jgi:hypothetical protein
MLFDTAPARLSGPGSSAEAALRGNRAVGGDAP